MFCRAVEAFSQHHLRTQFLFQFPLFHLDNLLSINTAFQGVLATYIENKQLKSKH